MYTYKIPFLFNCSTNLQLSAITHTSTNWTAEEEKKNEKGSINLNIKKHDK